MMILKNMKNKINKDLIDKKIKEYLIRDLDLSIKYASKRNKIHNLLFNYCKLSPWEKEHIDNCLYCQWKYYWKPRRISSFILFRFKLFIKRLYKKWAA